jgi:transaldolase
MVCADSQQSKLPLLLGFALPVIVLTLVLLTLLRADVGRVGDWHQRAQGKGAAFVWPVDQDPGITLTSDIFKHKQRYGYTTEVMGASFRNIDQVCAYS